MPRVQTKKKNKAGAERKCGLCGKTIKPGEKYFTWAFRYGGRRFRCSEHFPRRSALTMSKMGEVFAANEDAEDQLPKAETIDDIKEIVEQASEIARQVADEYEEAAEPFGGAGENQERADEVGEWADEVENFYPDEDTDLEDVRQEAIDLIAACQL
jgi:hypothetical protein